MSQQEATFRFFEIDIGRPFDSLEHETRFVIYAVSPHIRLKRDVGGLNALAKASASKRGCQMHHKRCEIGFYASERDIFAQGFRHAAQISSFAPRHKTTLF